jgi:uncharacterized protein YjdB
MAFTLDFGDSIRVVKVSPESIQIPAGKTVNVSVDITNDIDLDWFSNNDDVARVVVSDDRQSASVTALKSGQMTIQVQSRNVIRTKLLIDVAAPLGQAVGIEATPVVQDKP